MDTPSATKGFAQEPRSRRSSRLGRHGGYRRLYKPGPHGASHPEAPRLQRGASTDLQQSRWVPIVPALDGDGGVELCVLNQDAPPERLAPGRGGCMEIE